jgi:hypothetical protein
LRMPYRKCGHCNYTALEFNTNILQGSLAVQPSSNHHEYSIVASPFSTSV